MPRLRLSLCVEMWWPELEFPDRIHRAAAVGFKAFEFWGWWNKDLVAVERAAKETGLDVAACCVNTSFTGGKPNLLCAENKDAFIHAVKDCIPINRRIGCERFIVTTGNELPGVSREAQHNACVAALRAATPVAEDAGILLVLEPLNVLVDHKGYYLSSSAEGFAMVDEVGSPAVRLLFDIYHQQITEGNLSPNICANIQRIGHFHTANHPGRHELTSGEINYPYILRRIAETDYAGFIGLEFSPSAAGDSDTILRNTLDLV